MGVKNAIHQNDYGFTVGGPVWIPKLYNGRNQTFFFFSFEEFLQNLLNTTTHVHGTHYRLTATVIFPASSPPKIAWCQPPPGPTRIRSAAPFQAVPSSTPATTFTAPNGAQVRNPFPGNMIPVSRFDPVAAKILALVPLPQGPNCQPGGIQLSGAVQRQPQIAISPPSRSIKIWAPSCTRRFTFKRPPPLRPGPAREPTVCRMTSLFPDIPGMPPGRTGSTWTTL